MMEDWELDFEWLRIRHLVKDSLKQQELPDLNVVLLMIGIQELGRWQKQFSKEEKQDLMHIGICQLLTYDGYYTFVGRDADGWPHFKPERHFERTGEKAQERYLKEKAITYFQELSQTQMTYGGQPNSDS